jgi:hypothetical protein
MSIAKLEELLRSLGWVPVDDDRSIRSRNWKRVSDDRIPPYIIKVPRTDWIAASKAHRILRDATTVILR